MIKLLLLCLVSLASPTVIGIDLGSEFFKISLISPGKSFQIVENSITKRKTESSVSFVQGERYFEQQALNKRTKYYQNSFVGILKYLGASDPAKVHNMARVNQELHHISHDEESGFSFRLADYKLDGSKDDLEVSAQEIAAMILNYGRQLAVKQTEGGPIGDCVITVDPQANLQHRLAIYEAALIAGLKPLAFMGHNAAAALQMVISRNDLSNLTEAGSKMNVIMYNLGASGLKVSLVEIGQVGSSNSTRGKKQEIHSLSVLADSGSSQVSALLFDQALAEIVADAYDKQTGRQGLPSLRTYPSAMVKVLKEANRFKETLSANKQATFFIENILDGTDFRVPISREAFETKCAPFFQHLTAPIQDVLDKSGKNIADVHGLEILGGAIRVPKVQTIVKEFLDTLRLAREPVSEPVEVNAHLNGDESMAFGAAFHAANISTIYRVKPVHFYDGYEFDLQVVVRGLEENDDYYKESLLFPRKTRFGSKKSVAFKHDQDLQVQVNQLLEGQVVNLLTLNLTNITQTAAGLSDSFSKPKVSMLFKLGNMIPIEVESVGLSSEETKEVEVKEVTKVAKEDNSTEDLSTMVLRNQTKTVSLPLVQSVFQAIKANLTKVEASKKLLEKFVRQEALLVKKSEAKNRLESLVYLVGEKVADETFSQYLSQEQRVTLAQQAEDNDDWLYSDEADLADHSVFNRKSMTMQSVLDGAERRMTLHQGRKEMVSDLVRKIENFMIKVRQHKERNDWIEQAEINKVNDLVELTVANITMEAENQEKMALWLDPVLTEYSVKPKYMAVNEAFRKFKALKKPEPKSTVKDTDETVTVQASEGETENKEEKKSEEEEEKKEEEL